MTQINIILAAFLLLFEGFQFAIGPYYGEWFLPDDYKNCSSKTYKRHPLITIYSMLIYVRMSLSHLTMLIQVYEWHCAYFFINYQLSKSERELMMESVTEAE